MSTWSQAITGGTWYYNSDNTDIGLPIITADSTPSLSSYPQPPDFTNAKFFWQFPQSVTINLGLPYPQVYGTAPDLTNVKMMWKITDSRNYGLPYYTDIATYGAFTRCSNLTSVTIPVSVKKIGYYTFQDTDLSTVTIPADCYIYPTSFPSDCDIIWSLKDLQWANYDIDTSTGLSSDADMTRLLCFNYIPIPTGRNIMAVIPDITLSAEAAQTSPLQYLVCWYHGTTYLGYDDFATLQGDEIVAQEIMAGADRLRFCIKYTDNSQIYTSHFGNTCQVDWIYDVSQPVYTTQNNEVYFTSDNIIYTIQN